MRAACPTHILIVN